jgi:hypothetical protein
MSMTKFPTLTYHAMIWTEYLPTMKIHKGNHKRWVEYKDFELEKIGGTSKIGLLNMKMDRTFKHQHSPSKTYLLQTLPLLLDY